MYNIPLTINGNHEKPIGVVSLDEEGMFYVQKFFEQIKLSIARDSITLQIREFSLIVEAREVGPHDV